MRVNSRDEPDEIDDLENLEDDRAFPVAGQGLDVHFKMSIEVIGPDGRPFMEADYDCRTYGQSRGGVVAINQTAADLINAQVALGRLSADQHRGDVSG